jgi:hypothetical protein
VDIGTTFRFLRKRLARSSIATAKINGGARHRPPDVGGKSAKPSTLVSAWQLQTTCDQR